MRTHCGEGARVCWGRRLMKRLRSSVGESKGCGMAFGSLLLGILLLQVLEGVSAARGNVTLESIELATTHEWFSLKPNVYFACQGEPKVFLPDVTEKNKPYNFSGLESFQPLASLDGEKCKRCGFYEHDTIKSDDIFHEWELCPRAFSPAPENRFSVSVDKELNFALICEGCHPQVSATETPPGLVEMAQKEEHHGTGLKIAVTFFVGIVIVFTMCVGYLFYRKKQREEQQKRFIQLFEDDEDFDEELGLKHDL